MTDETMALVELLQKSGDGDFLRRDRMPPPGREIAHKIWLKISPRPDATIGKKNRSQKIRPKITPSHTNRVRARSLISCPQKAECLSVGRFSARV